MEETTKETCQIPSCIKTHDTTNLVRLIYILVLCKPLISVSFLQTSATVYQNNFVFAFLVKLYQIWRFLRVCEFVNEFSSMLRIKDYIHMRI